MNESEHYRNGKQSKQINVRQLSSVTDSDFFSSLPTDERDRLEKSQLNPDEISNLCCTICRASPSSLLSEYFCRHPILGIPVCHRCHDALLEQDWICDKDGVLECCCWCGNIPDVLLLCSKQSCWKTFCKKCIKSSFGRATVSVIEDKDDWLCFTCDSQQIFYLRSVYFSIYKNSTRPEMSDIVGANLENAQVVSKLFQSGLQTLVQSHEQKDQAEKSNKDYVREQLKKLSELVVETKRNLDRTIELLDADLNSKLPNIDDQQFPSLANKICRTPKQAEDSSRVENEDPGPSNRHGKVHEGVLNEDRLCERAFVKTVAQETTEDDPNPFHFLSQNDDDLHDNITIKEELIEIDDHASDDETTHEQQQAAESSSEKLAETDALDSVSNATNFIEIEDDSIDESVSDIFAETYDPVQLRVEEKTHPEVNKQKTSSCQNSESIDADIIKIKEDVLRTSSSSDESNSDTESITRTSKSFRIKSQRKKNRIISSSDSVNSDSNSEIEVCKKKIKSRTKNLISSESKNSCEGACVEPGEIVSQSFEDPKLKNIPVVGITKLPLEVESELERNKFVSFSKFLELLQFKLKHKARRPRSDEDKLQAEVDRLCNIEAVLNPRKNTKKSSKSKAIPKKRSAIESDMSYESDFVEESSSAEELFGKSLTESGQILDRDEKIKRAVLATSSEESGDGSEPEKDAEKKIGKMGKSENGKIHRKYDGLLPRVRLSATDSDDEETSSNRHRKGKSNGDAQSDDDRPKSSRRQSLNSESEDTDELSSDVDTKRKKKKKRRISGSSSSSFEEEPKKKRRRIRNMASSSSDDDEKKEGPSPMKGRHNIRKIIKDKDLSKSTREADREERDRRKRIEERQKIYNQTFSLSEDALMKELPLDFDPETKQIIIEVDKRIVKNLKPHQGKGIKFMWDAVFERKVDVLDGKVPGGAILAHCMGLGKTLQTIGLVHTVMKNLPETIRRVLIICPVNTIKNWVSEFEKWLPGELFDEITEVFDGSLGKRNTERADILKHWTVNGGCMIMGYDMYRNLTSINNSKVRQTHRNIFQEALVDPGPDMVICDEGHLLKNSKSGLNKTISKITTRRRIILTGTPLQNNLSEYFEMVNFVKPQLLGTFGEFKNRFVNPIQNGQHSDSTERDVRIMKKRSFILNDLLKGCMQRLDYNVLTPYLQPKYEYVLSVCLTDFQKSLYKFYLQNYARAGQIGDEGKMEGGKKGGLFYDVQNLSRVWNHPIILELANDRSQQKLEADDDQDVDDAGSLKDFIDDGSDSSSSRSSSSDSDVELISASNTNSVSLQGLASRSDFPHDVDESHDSTSRSRGPLKWWTQFIPAGSSENYLMQLELGGKMVLLFDILRRCEVIGDKVLVFSQSLLTLDLIEKFLQMENDRNRGNGGSWINGKDYYRMDGSTAPHIRKKWCNFFNQKSNHRTRLFLISTKAGGLGINLVAANRVIIFDASWNPADDVQSIFRVYRFGQDKPVYVYRFLAKGTMEEKIYDRQVTKQSLSARVVDEQQIERHFSLNELSELYEFKDDPAENRPVPGVPKDRLLAELLVANSNLIWKYHDHDSLLENQVDENLTEEERKAAWEEFEKEKRGIIVGNPSLTSLAALNIDVDLIATKYREDYPHLTEDQVYHATRAYIAQVQSAFTRKPAYDKTHYQQEMAKAKAMQQRQYPGLFRQGQTSLSMASASNGGSNSFMSMSAAELQRQVFEMQQHLHRHQQRYVATQQNDDDVIILDGSSQDIPGRPPSGARRGRPRLDPDTDSY